MTSANSYCVGVNLRLGLVGADDSVALGTSWEAAEHQRAERGDADAGVSAVGTRATKPGWAGAGPSQGSQRSQPAIKEPSYMFISNKGRQDGLPQVYISVSTCRRILILHTLCTNKNEVLQ